MVTAYEVNHSFATGDLKYTDASGNPQNLTSGWYVQKGNVLTASTAADNDWHQLVVNGNVTGESKKGDGTHATTFTYTVNGTINSMSISTGVQVIIGGHNYGVRQNGDKILFTAPVDGAKYALKQNITNGAASGILGTADGLTNAGANYAYTVDTTDANSGVIELVQVAQVDRTGVDGAYYDSDANGSIEAGVDANLTDNGYVAVGTTLYIKAKSNTLNDVIKVVNNGTAVQVSNSVASDGVNPATATYRVSSTDYALVISVGAP